MRECDFKETPGDREDLVNLKCYGCQTEVRNWPANKPHPLADCVRQWGLGEAISATTRVLHFSECPGCKNRKKIANRVSDVVFDGLKKVVGR